MLYLGIDQHARQISISLRDDTGDVLLPRQVSTRPEKIQAFFTKLTQERLRDGESFIAVVEGSYDVRDVVTFERYSVTVMTTSDLEEAEDYQSFLMFLFVVDFDKFEDETGLKPWESVDDVLTDIRVVTIVSLDAELLQLVPLGPQLPNWEMPDVRPIKTGHPRPKYPPHR